MEEQKTSIIVLNVGELKEQEASDVFSDFSLPKMVAPIKVAREKSFIHKLLAIPSIAELISKLNGKEFFVEIPKHLAEGLNTGKLHFGKSHQTFESLSPNIFDTNGKLVGQATIQNGQQAADILNSISNLSMMIMMQSLAEKLDDISKQLEILHKGQKNDRLGKIIGSFRAYAISRSSERIFVNQEERRKAAHMSYTLMCEGICQMHFELNEFAKRISELPHNNIQLFFKNMIDRTDYEREYKTFVNDLYDLYNMTIISDTLLLDLDATRNDIINNHKSLNAFMERAITDKLINTAKFIVDDQPRELTNFINQSKNALIDFSREINCNSSYRLDVKL
jgi:hypothetical protein